MVIDFFMWQPFFINGWICFNIITLAVPTYFDPDYLNLK